MLAAMEPGNYWQWEALRLWWLRTLMAVMKWCIGLPQEKQTCLYLWNSCNSILLELDLRPISQKCCVLSLNIQRILSTSIPRATGLMWCSVHTGIFRAQRSALCSWSSSSLLRSIPPDLLMESTVMSFKTQPWLPHYHVSLLNTHSCPEEKRNSVNPLHKPCITCSVLRVLGPRLNAYVIVGIHICFFLLGVHMQVYSVLVHM